MMQRSYRNMSLRLTGSNKTGTLVKTQIWGRRKMNKSRYFTRIDLVAIIVILVVLFVVLLNLGPTLAGHSAEQRSRMSCTSNLKQLGLALKQYAMDYADRFPALAANPTDGSAIPLEQLRQFDYLTDYSVYTCPSTCTYKGTGTVPLTLANCDYAFANGMMEGASDQYGRADSAIASDRKVNPSLGPNHFDFGNMLFHDGHVTGFSGTTWYIYKNRGGSSMFPNTETAP